MDHYWQGIYFGRRKDKSVRVLKFREPVTIADNWPDRDYTYLKPEIDLVIPAEDWVTINYHLNFIKSDTSDG